jgi:signal transduction histidine kinase
MGEVMQTNDFVRGPGPAVSTRQSSGHHWNWWLIPKPFDLVSSLLYLGVLLPFLYSFITRSGYSPALVWWQVALVIGAIAVLLAVDRLEYRFYGEQVPGRVAVLLFFGRVVLIEVLCWQDQFQYSPFLYLILIFLGCLYFGDLVGYGLSVLAGIVYFVKHFWYSPGWLSNGTERHYLVLFILGCIFSITIARVVVRESAIRARAEELFAELTRSHQQLQEYAGQVAELATTRERNRLAREIHDSLGHYLTVISVQLEKAQAFRDKKPGEANQAVNDAKRLVSEALQDVRRSVSALRATEELPAFLPAITELVEHTRGEYCPIALHIDGDALAYSPQSLLVLYRVVQEGLTNVQKHAGRCQVEIDLRFKGQEANLTIHDTGCGFDFAHHQLAGSYGLMGLQERVALVGGSLAIESVPGQGTTLRVCIPAVDNSSGRKREEEYA